MTLAHCPTCERETHHTGEMVEGSQVRMKFTCDVCGLVRDGQKVPLATMFRDAGNTDPEYWDRKFGAS